jgi:pimeloyl-ACP methyl ester carboxylesterase
VRRLAAILASTVVLAGCSLLGDDKPDPKPLEASPPDSSSASPSSPVPEGLEAFYSQQVEWESCREDSSCTEIEVPLDYDQPDGETIEISVIRVPAEKQGDKVGALFVNPGGPGASGVDYAASASIYFREVVTDHFDIIGFDPRGVGRSSPIDCLTDDQLDEFVASDPDPDDAAEEQEAMALLRQFAQGCLQRSGRLTEHLSTEEAARDLDILRAVLEQPQLVYFGASYGTFLGATFAELFPDNVGRLVLDGAIDPTVSFLDFNLTQAKSFETAVRAYVQHCVDSDGCPLQGSVDDGVDRIQQFLRDVDEQPLPTGTDRELTQGRAVLGLWAPLYNRSYWTLLDSALDDALQGDGAALLTLSDAYLNRGPDGYNDNSMEALYAVNCLDRDEWIEPDEVERVQRRFEREAPTFGRIMAYGMTACGSWGVHTEKTPGPLRAEGSAPILVIGTSRDPATPLVWAEGLAEQLDNGVLVRRDGDGHTGYNVGNKCVDEVVESYLVSGEVPDGDVDC